MDIIKSFCFLGMCSPDKESEIKEALRLLIEEIVANVEEPTFYLCDCCNFGHLVRELAEKAEKDETNPKHIKIISQEHRYFKVPQSSTIDERRKTPINNYYTQKDLADDRDFIASSSCLVYYLDARLHDDPSLFIPLQKLAELLDTAIQISKHDMIEIISLKNYLK